MFRHGRSDAEEPLTAKEAAQEPQTAKETAEEPLTAKETGVDEALTAKEAGVGEPLTAKEPGATEPLTAKGIGSEEPPGTAVEAESDVDELPSAKRAEEDEAPTTAKEIGSEEAPEGSFAKEVAAEKGRSRKAPPSKYPTCNLFLTAHLVAIGGGFMFGYQKLITNPAQDAFMAFLNSSYQEIHGETKDFEFIEYLWGVIVSSFFWGATAGSLLIGMIADWVGRKNGLIFTYIVQILAVIMEIISFFTNSYIMYTVSRIILGVAISISLGIGPMFVIECSPVSCRGIISMSTGVLLQCGLVVGSIVAMPEIWGTTKLWYLVYLLELVLTAGVLIIFCWAPESPSYTATKLNDDKRAERAVVYYHGISAEEAVSVVEGMKKSSVKGETPLGLFEIFADKEWRCGFLIGNGIMAGTVLGGVAVVNAFAFEMLVGVGLTDLQAALGNIVICVMAVVGVLTSGQLVERVGRRPLLLITFFGLTVIHCLISGFMYSFQRTSITALGWGVVVCCCFFNLFFAAGPGPLCFFVPGELVNEKARSATYTWLNIVMNGGRSFLLAAYFPIQDALGGPLCYFVLCFPPCFLSVLLCFFFLPETTGLTPEEARKAMHKMPGFCGKGKEEDEEKAELNAA